MLRYQCPCFPCYLSDGNGDVIGPHKPGAIQYVNLSAGDNYAQSQYISENGRLQTDIISAILVKGFVTVFGRGAGATATIPFRNIQCIRSASGTDGFVFVTTCFGCCAMPVFRHKGGRRYAAYIKVRVTIKTAVFEESPAGSQEGAVYRTSFCTCITAYRRSSSVRAKVNQYNTLSDGKSRVYTSEDALPEYGGQGLVSPEEASIHNLFVNGMMQPKNSYRLSEEALELLTEDVPKEGEPIVVSYVRLLDGCNRKLSAAHRYYIAVSDGVSATYTDSDRLAQYESSGIPDPRNVSYYNLYVNAVLQPTATYKVQKGVLELTSAPENGQYVIFESVTVLEP